MEGICVMGAMLVWVLAMACGAVEQEAKDLEILLDEVNEIAAPGVPGPLCVFGEQAFPVVVGGDKLREPIVAAGRMGKGRVVAFGHTGYLNVNSLKTADTGRLMINSLRWAADNDNPRIAVYRKPGLVTFLRGQGLEAELLRGDGWTDKLGSFDVLCVRSH
ncbi:hypothetical protein ACFL6S_19080 [Candidatus Poribacteria bacterium]